MSTSTLALMLGIDPSTASRNLAGLERGGTSSAGAAPRTAARPTSPDASRQANGRGRIDGWTSVLASLLERLPRPERQRIADALDTLARVLDGGGDR